MLLMDDTHFLFPLIALGLALSYTHNNFYNFYNRDYGAGVEVVTDKAVSKLASINTVSTQSRATRFRKWSATK